MGITSENVAERYGVGRKQQDVASVSLTFVTFLNEMLHLHLQFVPSFLALVATENCLSLSYWQVASHHKAAAARSSGRFKDEIVPVHTKVTNLFLLFTGSTV